jgi:hypothetical protein
MRAPLFEPGEFGEQQRVLVLVEADAGIDHIEPHPRCRAGGTPPAPCRPAAYT